MMQEVKISPDPEAGVADQLPHVDELRMDLGGARPRRKKRIIIVVAAILAVLAIVLAISIPVSKNNSDNASSTDPAITNREPRFEEVVAFLVESGISEESALRSEGSPQNLGAKFIADEDPLYRALPSSMEDEKAYLFVQRYVLSVMFYALGGPSWRTSLRWVTAGDECYDWYQTVVFSDGDRTPYGCFCENGEVSAIRVPYWGAKGQIPDEVGFLSSLKYLNLQQNLNIEGGLPESMSALSDLEYLALHYNSLSGPLPTWIGELSKLEVLSFSNNDFTGKIPTSWRKLSSITSLGLDDNLLSGHITPLRGLTELKYLYLEDNGFEHNVDDIDLSGWDKLIHLDLSDNLFSGTIPSYWLETETLEVLDLSSNRFNGSLADSFSDQNALQYLFLYNNTLDGEIPVSIASPPNLTHLDLSINKFSGEIPVEIGNARKLEYLFLAENDFTPGPIPTWLFDLNMLSDLSLKATQRTGPIPELIGVLDLLVMLDLDRNELEGSLPTELGDMASLELLLLNRNNFTGPVPTELGMLTKLELLMLDNNTITGSVNELCPKWRALQYFISDCEGDTPEIECKCCTECCNDNGPACNDEDLLAEFNPIWEVGYRRRDYIFGDNITVAD